MHRRANSVSMRPEVGKNTFSPIAEDKMQNTIRAERISYKSLALIVMFVAVALLAGFAAGLAVSTPSSASVSPAGVQPEPALLTQPRAPTSGWVYHHDSVTNKWYAYHYESTPAGFMIDEPYELPNGPGNSENRCGLVPAEPDC